MTSPRLNLLVIRSEEPSNTVGFYELLGLRIQEEQHGKGAVVKDSDGRWVVLVQR